jgi:hypothetical protein
VKPFVPLTFAIAAAGIAAAALRFLVVEPEATAHLCSAPGAPGWCAARAIAIAAFGTGALAAAAVLAGVVATVTRRTGAAVAAVALGVAGLVLYSVEAGAVAFLLGLLALARSRERQAPGGSEQEG